MTCGPNWAKDIVNSTTRPFFAPPASHSTPTLAGLHEGFPALVADSPGKFVQSVLELVADAGQRRRLAEDAWAYAHEHYTTDAWVPTLWRLVEPEGATAPRWVSPRRVASVST